jgi:hypothetical protein
MGFRCEAIRPPSISVCRCSTLDPEAFESETKSRKFDVGENLIELFEKLCINLKIKCIVTFYCDSSRYNQ